MSPTDRPSESEDREDRADAVDAWAQPQAVAEAAMQRREACARLFARHDRWLFSYLVVLQGNFAFDRISLANFDGTKTHEIDDLRVGTPFLAVTGRWGGERGRLLRQLTRRPVAQGKYAGGGDGRAGLGSFRNSMLATTFDY